MVIFPASFLISQIKLRTILSSLPISHPASEEDAAVVATEPGHAAAQPRPRHAADSHQDLGARVPQPDVHVILVPGPETANTSDQC